MDVMHSIAHYFVALWNPVLNLSGTPRPAWWSDATVWLDNADARLLDPEFDMYEDATILLPADEAPLSEARFPSSTLPPALSMSATPHLIPSPPSYSQAPNARDVSSLPPPPTLASSPTDHPEWSFHRQAALTALRFRSPPVIYRNKRKRNRLVELDGLTRVVAGRIYRTSTPDEVLETEDGPFPSLEAQPVEVHPVTPIPCLPPHVLAPSFCNDGDIADLDQESDDDEETEQEVPLYDGFDLDEL
jgi:hypothetical protein